MDTGIDIDGLLARLDVDQLAAVTAPPGPVAVLAGAGSGKTRVLTTRIAYRIAAGTAHASHVVAFTFTRQAAGELQRRLADFAAGAVVAGTFHSVAYRIMRQRWEDRGRREPPTLITNRIGLLTEVLGGDRRLAGIAAAEIEWARARLVTPADYPGAAMAAARRPGADLERVAQVFAAFETQKRRSHVLDFDDLLSQCVEELRRPGVAEAVSWFHRHLHVDEFQDINPLQFQFLEVLRHGGTDLFVVGDPAQAIYGWNGADPRLLDRVADGELRPVVVRLARNHRSAPDVVEAADRVLDAHSMPAGHVSARAAGDPVVSVAAADEAQEAAAVVSLARRLRPPGAPWRSVAVLARTNELLRQLAFAFREAGIPVRTAASRGDTAAGRADLLRQAKSARDAAQLHTWAVDLAWPADPDADPSATGLDDQGLDPVAALQAVRAFEETGGGSGPAFAAWAALNDVDAGPGEDAVEFVTIHSAKGREWPTVIIAGVDTASFPAPSSARSAVRAEEARVLYVAMTRAVDRLAVTWCERRNGVPAQRSPMLPSLERVEPAVAGDAEPVHERRPRVRRAPADPVLSRLTEWRSRAAHAAGVPPDFVLDDATLRRLATARPATMEELAGIEGVGPMAARHFGGRILPLLVDQPT